jgi:hypothetical protein
MPPEWLTILSWIAIIAAFVIAGIILYALDLPDI